MSRIDGADVSCIVNRLTKGKIIGYEIVKESERSGKLRITVGQE